MSALVLTNLSCTSISAKSQYIADIIANPDNYTQVNISLQKNCCSVGYTAAPLINFVPSDNPQKITLQLGVGLVIQTITVQNLSTGSFYIINIVSDELTACSDMTGVLASLNSYMTTNFTSGDDFTATCDDSTSVMQYTLASNSGKFVVYSLNYTIPSSTQQQTIYFTNLTGFSAFFSSTGIIIQSQWVNKNLFDDGLYSVTITIVQINGTTIVESGCIFINCNTQCRLANALPIATDEDAQVMVYYYYGLTFTQSCMCDCTFLCKMYESLDTMLNNYSPSNTSIDNACGCIS